MKTGDIQCRAPLRATDQVRCTCKCVSSKAARSTFEQTLVKLPKTPEEIEQASALATLFSTSKSRRASFKSSRVTCVQVVLEATAIVVSLDRKYRPKRMPQEVIDAMKTGDAPGNIMSFLL